jgi:hypothetical protein
MIQTAFPTYFTELSNAIDAESLLSIYNFAILNHDTIVTPLELPALASLKSKINEESKKLAALYNFDNVTVSDRFSTHFYPAGTIGEMELHSDDLGDHGRKFIAFLYLEAENSDNTAGELELFDPRWLNAPWRNSSCSIKIKPVTNTLVIFPTFIWHKVNPYYSNTTPRMAIDVVIRLT